MRLTFSVTPVSWLLASTLFTTGLSFSAAIFNPCGSTVQAARTIGRDGEDGTDGRAGRAGRAGDDSTVRATGSPMNVNLAGEDGSNGEAGEHAVRARCGVQDRPSRDLEAADGGDGGAGGRGGAGGDGGQLTVYYQQLGHLRNIYVNAAGGRGGEGGRGGRGTEGCDCEDDEWTITTCTDGTCTSSEYECEDGDRGQDGGYGSTGKEGELGRARLIESSGPLENDNPSVESAIATFSSSPVALSRNLWEVRTGAKYFFAEGSTVGDEYDQYAGRAEKSFQLVWDAERPRTTTEGNLKVEIDPQGELQVTTQDDLWIKGDFSNSDDENLTTYRVQGAVLASEALKLSLGRNRGRGQALTVNVIDTASQSDLVDTQFRLRYYTDEGDRRSRFISRYEGAVPAELVTQDYNRFSVALGQLPINASHLGRGTQVRMELTVIRSYGDNTAEQVLNWSGRL